MKYINEVHEEERYSETTVRVCCLHVSAVNDECCTNDCKFKPSKEKCRNAANCAEEATCTYPCHIRRPMCLLPASIRKRSCATEPTANYHKRNRSRVYCHLMSVAHIYSFIISAKEDM